MLLNSIKMQNSIKLLQICSNHKERSIEQPLLFSDHLMNRKHILIVTDFIWGQM